MILLKILELGIVALVGYFILLEIIIPALRGEDLFPMFNKERGNSRDTIQRSRTEVGTVDLSEAALRETELSTRRREEAYRKWVAFQVREEEIIASKQRQAVQPDDDFITTAAVAVEVQPVEQQVIDDDLTSNFSSSAPVIEEVIVVNDAGEVVSDTYSPPCDTGSNYDSGSIDCNTGDFNNP